MSDFDYGGFDPVAMLGKMQEEQRKAEKESQQKYIPRREAKVEHRRRIESTAMKLCGLIDAAVASEEPGEFKPEEITVLAAALNNLAVALHSAESCAEYQPPGVMGKMWGP